jgi:uncharacterized protein with PIN domain
MKFLCDQMLGSLSNWLRFFGFDTVYIKNEIDDDALLNIAEKEGRVILTRDKELIIRANKKKLNVIDINTIDLDDQLRNVLRNIEIDKKIILSRCSICNSLLKKINKKEVKNRIPSKIYNSKDDYFYCEKCDKIYWMGSHYDKIIKKIFEIKKDD